MPERVQLKRTRGWRMPDNTVKVDRSTKWGNPYRVGAGVDSHRQAVDLFRDAIENDRWHVLDFGPTQVAQLRGKDLACWCAPGDPCHADVLLEYANRPLRVVE